MNSRYKIEATEIDEKETFVHIYNSEKTATIYTTDFKVYNKMYKAYGTPHETYSPVSQKGDNFISGASWTFDYTKERANLRSMFSMSKILPHS